MHLKLLAMQLVYEVCAQSEAERTKEFQKVYGQR